VKWPAVRKDHLIPFRYVQKLGPLTLEAKLLTLLYWSSIRHGDQQEEAKLMRRWYSLALLPGIAVVAAASVNATRTFYKDVLPILQVHCLSCHGPDHLAPISFLTYRETRPWAEAMKQVVMLRTMPPSWSQQTSLFPPTEHHGLTPREVDTIVTWVEEGALAGDPRDAPSPFYVDWAERIGPASNAPPEGLPVTSFSPRTSP
jgi:hypothetical protein